MTKVVNVRFRDAGKAYRFTTGGLSLGIGDSVIVETEQGIDLAHVCEEPYDLEGDVKDILPIKYCLDNLFQTIPLFCGQGHPRLYS